MDLDGEVRFPFVHGFLESTVDPQACHRANVAAGSVARNTTDATGSPQVPSPIDRAA